MYVALLVFIAVDAVLLVVTAAAGVTLDGREAVLQHFTLGLGTSIFTCFIHCLSMFYLIGTGKDVRDAVEEHPALAQKYVPLTRELKRRVFPLACLASALIILTALMGGEVHSRIIRPDGSVLLRDVPGWWVHAVVVVFALVANALAFRAEVRAAVDNRRAIEEINRTLAATDASPAAR